MSRNTNTLTIAMAQANPTVGDIAGNVALARKFRAEAAAAGADVVVLSELFLTGYPRKTLSSSPLSSARHKTPPKCWRPTPAMAARRY